MGLEIPDELYESAVSGYEKSRGHRESPKISGRRDVKSIVRSSEAYTLDGLEVNGGQRREIALNWASSPFTAKGVMMYVTLQDPLGVDRRKGPARMGEGARSRPITAWLPHALRAASLAKVDGEQSATSAGHANPNQRTDGHDIASSLNFNYPSKTIVPNRRFARAQSGLRVRGG